MQTIKTAAIVVLLMTVMYGAYVSMTTPPEPLPPDVEGMLVLDEQALEIDAGLPESLEALEISTPAVASGQPDVGAQLDAGGFAIPGPGSFAATTPASEFDVPADPTLQIASAADTGVTTHLSDTTIPASAMNVPADASLQSIASAEASPGTTPRYPTTNSTFELPDPDSVVADFSQSKSSDLALTSGTSSPVPEASPSLTAPASAVNIGLANAIQSADQQYAEDRRTEALATLSIFYNTPNLSGEQRSELLARLDPLAREVIYSRKHMLEQPYRVGHSETLMDVAVRYEVPWQLLANINQIDDPATVLPGTELKVVRGPFRAEISLSAKELTLFLGDMYAGRFPVGIGNDPAPKPGTFTVQDKQTGRTYYNAQGLPIPPGSPNNPYGEFWLDLGGQLCIHGSSSTTSPSGLGCISLAANYADDLYGILSQGSSVTIRR